VDGAPLRCISYEGVEIHTCDSCGGELVTPQEMIHIINVREQSFPDELISLLSHRVPTPGMPDEAGHRQVDCPCCESTMTVLNYASDTAVIVDKCPTCSALWLDNDELEKVQVLLERWQDEAPEAISEIAGRLEDARREAEDRAGGKFAGSRFGFVNAMINRLLDAA
jgi:Zn-finger nucleic acid-binding protein